MKLCHWSLWKLPPWLQEVHTCSHPEAINASDSVFGVVLGNQQGRLIGMEYYQHCKCLSEPTMLMFLTAAPSAPDGQQCEHGLWVWQLWGQRKIALLAWTPLMTSLENRRTDTSKESEQEKKNSRCCITTENTYSWESPGDSVT